MRKSVRKFVFSAGLATAPIAGMAVTSGDAEACLECSTANKCVITPEQNQGYLNCFSTPGKCDGGFCCSAWGLPCV
jgi:hypothetical protein